MSKVYHTKTTSLSGAEVWEYDTETKVDQVHSVYPSLWRAKERAHELIELERVRPYNVNFWRGERDDNFNSRNAFA